MDDREKYGEGIGVRGGESVGQHLGSHLYYLLFHPINISVKITQRPLRVEGEASVQVIPLARGYFRPLIKESLMNFKTKLLAISCRRVGFTNRLDWAEGQKGSDPKQQIDEETIVWERNSK